MPNLPSRLHFANPQLATNLSPSSRHNLEQASALKGSELILESPNGASQVLSLDLKQPQNLAALGQALNQTSFVALVDLELPNGESVVLDLDKLSKDKLIAALNQAPNNLSPELRQQFIASATPIIQTIRGLPTPPKVEIPQILNKTYSTISQIQSQLALPSPSLNVTDYQGAAQKLLDAQQKVLTGLFQVREALNTPHLKAAEQTQLHSELKLLNQGLKDIAKSLETVSKQRFQNVERSANQLVHEARQAWAQDYDQGKMYAADGHVRVLEAQGQLEPQALNLLLTTRGLKPELADQFLAKIPAGDKKLQATLATLSLQGIESLNRHSDYVKHFLDVYRQVTQELAKTNPARSQATADFMQEGLKTLLETGATPTQAFSGVVPSGVERLLIPDPKKFEQMQGEIQSRNGDLSASLQYTVLETLKSKGIQSLDFGYVDKNKHQSFPWFADSEDGKAQHLKLELIPDHPETLSRALLQLHTIAQAYGVSVDELAVFLNQQLKNVPPNQKLKELKLGSHQGSAPTSRQAQKRYFQTQIQHQNTAELAEAIQLQSKGQIQTQLLAQNQEKIQTWLQQQNYHSPAAFGLKQEFDLLRHSIAEGKFGIDSINKHRTNTNNLLSADEELLRRDTIGELKDFHEIRGMKLKDLVERVNLHNEVRGLGDNLKKLLNPDLYEASISASSEKGAALLGVIDNYKGLVKTLEGLSPESRAKIFQEHPQLQNHLQLLNDLSHYEAAKKTNPDHEIVLAGRSPEEMQRIEKFSTWLEKTSQVRNLLTLPATLQSLGSNAGHILLYLKGSLDIADRVDDRHLHLSPEMQVALDMTRGDQMGLVGKQFKIDGKDPLYTIMEVKKGVVKVNRDLPKQLKPNSQMKIEYAWKHAEELIQSGIKIALDAGQTAHGIRDTAKLATATGKAIAHSAPVRAAANGATRLTEQMMELIQMLKPEAAKADPATLSRMEQALKPIAEKLQNTGALDTFESLLSKLKTLIQKVGGPEEVQKAVKIIQEGGEAEKAAAKAEAHIPVLGTLMALGFVALDTMQIYDHAMKPDSDSLMQGKKLTMDFIALSGDVASAVPEPTSQAFSLCCAAAQIGGAVGDLTADVVLKKLGGEEAMGYGIDWSYANTAENIAHHDRYLTATDHHWMTSSELLVREAAYGVKADAYDDDDNKLGPYLNRLTNSALERGELTQSEAMLLRQSAYIDQNGKYVGSAATSWQHREAISNQLYADHNAGKLEEVEFLLLMKGLGGDPYKQDDAWTEWSSHETAAPPSDDKIQQALHRLEAKYHNETDPVQKMLLEEKYAKVRLWIDEGPPGAATLKVNYD